ncbi:hypothetical protein GA0070558_15119 [Micromonospora haikouensis]|uniref:ORC1/DEAH AAA+ ATPase domain-containing protein n=1 Tax=Micromonospora haikouensis TaxID=686309 RepID=A0A1C4YJV9_9ACTN|nr:protein DpdH [Micromonospora haikouensis]SCF20994.1 hypothetical protein GA0070558_15119 [Micromonospora haikouensis]
MAEFRQYLCWSFTTAAATISTEAVSPAPSVFFATHAPLRIRRRHPEGRADGLSAEVTEEQVRRDFLERPTSNGVLLMPVVGESGAGKSHLVRWVHEKTPPTRSRVVIYLPKSSTSLRAVVRALLDQPDIDSPELAQLRADVDRMSSELDQHSLERRLVNELSEAVAVADPKPGAARVLAGPDRLAALLLDPHIRDYLLQDGRLIPRLAASLLADHHSEQDNERPTSFTVDDLPLDVADVRKASDKAYRLLMQLTSKSELQTAAVDILTEQLPNAVTAAWNIGGGRLQHAMLEIRRQYARQGKEIIFLVEDFVVLQGVQRDLLDALIEVGVRDGRTVLAPVRTLMAVTTGYFERLTETVLTRAKAATPYLYDLDVAFDTSERGQAEVAAFVGRYLNAARLGQEALADAGVAAGAEVPNKCEDCPFRQTCHSTFGASSEGHGLYPFNWPALRRAIRARPAHNSPDSFNPRAVIGEVIRPVLVEHAVALRDGTFPDERFRADYPTAPGEKFLLGAVRQEVEERDPAGAPRRETFLEFWGDAPEQVVNLDPKLHAALGIGLLRLDEAPSPRAGSATTPAPVTARPNHPQAVDPATAEAIPARVRKMIDDIENWQGRGAQLPQSTALALRNTIRQTVISRCLWTDPIVAEPLTSDLDKAWPARSTVISIEGAEGEARRAGSDPAPIYLKRGAANASFFRQLLLAGAGVLPGNVSALRRLHRLAEQHQRTLQQAVVRWRAFSDEELVLAMRASLLGAVLIGRAQPGMTDQMLLDAVLDDGVSWSRPDARGRTPAWMALWESHRAARPELVARLRESVGYRRGTTGSVRIVDAVRAVPLLRRAAQEWSWQRPGRLPEWAAKSVTGLARFADIVKAQVDQLSNELSQIRVGLPAGVSAGDTVTAVEQALEAALGEGLGPDDLNGFRDLLAEAKRCDWRCVDRIERDLTKVEAATAVDEHYRALVVAAARNEGADLAVIRRFLTASDTWLGQKLAAAKLRAGGSGAAAAVRVQDLLHRWKAMDGGPE